MKEEQSETKLHYFCRSKFSIIELFAKVKCVTCYFHLNQLEKKSVII